MAWLGVASREPEHGRPVALDQDHEGMLVTGPEAVQQWSIGIRLPAGLTANSSTMPAAPVWTYRNRPPGEAAKSTVPASGSP